jgi:uncharacterized protein YdeI (YjbR/CyaY-like superfamily)
MQEDYPLRRFATASAFEQWLSRNHAKADGIRIQFARKSSGIRSIDYAQALEVALCYGWIDGQAKSIDDEWFSQRFTPRRARSIWSKRNRDIVARLIAEGRMQPPGLEAVDRAKANGQWDSAYDSHRTARVPPDLQRALDARPKAKAFFATLNSANRYAILFRIQTVKRAETRARKIEQFVDMLERHEVIHS